MTTAPPLFDAAFWDTRYSDEEYAYGKEPSTFMVESIEKLIKGNKINTNLSLKVLLIADGEGRNSIYLASTYPNFDIHSMDQSKKGMERLSNWATELKLTNITTYVDDINNFEFKDKEYGIIISIFAHFPVDLRIQTHSRIEKALKNNGLYILQGYSTDNIGRCTGGPQDSALCYTTNIVLKDFKNVELLVLNDSKRIINEGKYHVCIGDNHACVIEAVITNRKVPLNTRQTVPADYLRVMSILVDWFDGLDLRMILPRLFFEHFNNTSMIIDNEDGEIVSFLVGFISQSDPTVAYIHFQGVNPKYRCKGIATYQYNKFFNMVQSNGNQCNRVTCLTEKTNLKSRGFHAYMGFHEEDSVDEPELVEFHRKLV